MAQGLTSDEQQLFVKNMATEHYVTEVEDLNRVLLQIVTADDVFVVSRFAQAIARSEILIDDFMKIYLQIGDLSINGVHSVLILLVNDMYVLNVNILREAFKVYNFNHEGFESFMKQLIYTDIIGVSTNPDISSELTIIKPNIHLIMASKGFQSYKKATEAYDKILPEALKTIEPLDFDDLVVEYEDIKLEGSPMVTINMSNSLKSVFNAIIDALKDSDSELMLFNSLKKVQYSRDEAINKSLIALMRKDYHNYTVADFDAHVIRFCNECVQLIDGNLLNFTTNDFAAIIDKRLKADIQLGYNDFKYVFFMEMLREFKAKTTRSFTDKIDYSTAIIKAYCSMYDKINKYIRDIIDEVSKRNQHFVKGDLLCFT